MALAFATPGAPSADGDWIIDRFDAVIDVQGDGTILVNEAMDVDFGALQRHGIFRDLPVRYRWDSDPSFVRVYRVRVNTVRDPGGRDVRYSTSSDDGTFRVIIGDPDRTVTGKQGYRIAYTVTGAINGFADRDELYWNVNGGAWPVAMRTVTAAVRASVPAFTGATCYAGPSGSTRTCAQTISAQRLDFSAQRALGAGEQLTIVAAIRKGVVPEPRPILERRAREPGEFFDITPLTVGGGVGALALGVLGVGALWWTRGRDPREPDVIVPEYEPPQKLRPAQLGVLLDEKADPKDATATVIDLAVRGYLGISELPREGIFGSRDWLIERKTGDASALLPYEKTLYEGLFASGDATKLSLLRRHFYTTLGEAQTQLYRDAVDRGWFPSAPDRVRNIYGALGFLSLLIAAGLVVLLGRLLGAGLVGIGAALGASTLAIAGPRMPRRTGVGAQLLRRVWGFRRYMEVAETDRQRFAERESIFSEYLPYAIVFGCVDRWARAFAGIDAAAATAGWYAGTSSLASTDLSRDLSAFSSEVAGAIASTPGGSGSSGFSGGGAGGGGGGGGGGSW